MKDRWKSWLPFGSLFLTVVLVAVYILTDDLTNSDYIEGTLWAGAALESGRLLSPEFYYAYAMPLGGNVFMLPFMALWGVGMAANRAGMLLWYLLTLAALWTLAGGISRNKSRQAGIMALSLFFVFTACGENITHHILHYGAAWTAWLGLLGCLFRLGKAAGAKEKWGWGVGLALWSFWPAANGFVSVALAIAPVIAGAVGAAIFTKTGQRTRFEKPAGLLLPGALLGFLVGRLAMRGVRDTGYIGNLSLRLPGQWIGPLKKLPVDWLGLFRLAESDGCSRLASGLPAVVLGILCFVVTLSPLWALWRYKSLKNEERILFFSHLSLAALCIAEYLVFRDYDRVLYNMLLSGFVLTAVLLFREGERICVGSAAATLGFLLILALPLLRGFQPFVIGEDGMNRSVADGKRMTEELSERGLHHGFASFRNANVYTAISGGDVWIREICINPGDVSIRYYQSEEDWYEQPAGKSFFLLLEPEEYEQVIRISPWFEESARSVEKLDWHWLLTYDMSDWTVVTEQRVLSYGAHSASIHCSDGDDRVGERLLLSQGEMQYGPYTAMEPGTYEVELRGDGFDGCRVDSCCDQGTVVFAIEVLEHSDELIRYELILDQTEDDMEFRFFNESEGEVYWESLLVSRIGE